MAVDSDRKLDEPRRIQARLGECGGGDPDPEGFLLETSDAEALPRAVERRLPRERANVFGAALVETQGRYRVVVLRALRRATVLPIPPRLEPGGQLVLTGSLLGDLREPRVLVEGPNGAVTSIPAIVDGQHFRAAVSLVGRGSYVIEVMGRGRVGPEVAWLFTVGTGSPVAASAAEEPRTRLVDPRPELQASAVFEAINRLRLRQGEAALALDPSLSVIAERYSREMRDGAFFAHVSPISGDLSSRLAKAGYRFTRAGENLAEGRDALAAHALAEGSPAHRKNLLDPGYDRCGIGVTWGRDAAGQPLAIVTEIFAGG
ncbi:MAG: CAP domain-containing protein [Deltaproteobacteria bacterium]